MLERLRSNAGAMPERHQDSRGGFSRCTFGIPPHATTIIPLTPPPHARIPTRPTSHALLCGDDASRSEDAAGTGGSALRLQPRLQDVERVGHKACNDSAGLAACQSGHKPSVGRTVGRSGRGSTGQPDNRANGRWSGRSTKRSGGQSVGRSAGRAICRPNARLDTLGTVGRTVGRSNGWSDGRADGRSVEWDTVVTTACPGASHLRFTPPRFPPLSRASARIRGTQTQSDN